MRPSPRRSFSVVTLPQPDRVEILGHRGSVGLAGAPENTVAAVAAALGDGADGVEVDVGLTADGVPVCVHDPDLLRVTGRRFVVGASSYVALRRVELPGSQSVARLDDVLSVARGHFVLDLKHESGDAGPLVAVVRG